MRTLFRVKPRCRLSHSASTAAPFGPAGGRQPQVVLCMDVEQIKALVELMSQNALTEIMIRDGESRVVLRRGPMGGADVTRLVAAAPIPVARPLAAHPAPTAAPANPDAGRHVGKAHMAVSLHPASSAE